MNKPTVTDHLFRTLTLLLAAVWLWTPVLGTAAEPAGVDLLFMIDQSGSMMGKGASPGIRNDPHGKRIDTIRQLEDQLVQSAQAGYVNRLSVVEFGGRNAKDAAFRPQLTLSRLELPALIPGQDSQALRDRLRNGLLPVQPRFRGDTDIAHAMAIAQQELDAFAVTPPALGAGAKAGKRQRIAVLITDGAPYAEGVNQNVLRAEIESWTGQLKGDGSPFKFMVFGLNDGETDYWQLSWGDFWSRVASPDPKDGEGLAFLLAGAEEAGEKVNAVLSEFIPPSTGARAGADTYTVPAYLKGLNFTIDFGVPDLPDSAIDVRGPDGLPLVLTDRQAGFGTIALHHPQPGLYQLRSGRARYSARPQAIYESISLVTPTTSVPQYSDVQFAYRLGGRGPGGLFVPQTNLPAVLFELSIDGPGSTRRTLALQYDPSSGNVVSPQPQRFDALGAYTLAFTGTTTGQDGSEYVVYRRDDRLVVDAATPVQAWFASPLADSVVGLWRGYAKVPVTVRFRHAHTGVDIAAGDVLASAAAPTIGYAVAAGDPAAVPDTAVPLTVSGTELTAVLPIDFGRTRWDLLRAKEPLRLVFGASDPAWRDGFHYVGVAGSNDYWLGPDVLVQESPLVLWIWVLPLLGLLVALAVSWRLLLVPWLIRNNDRKYKLEPLLSYRPSRSPDAIKNWPLKGVRVLTEPRFVTLTDLTPWTIARFRVRRLHRPGKQVAVQVRYRPFGAKKGQVVAVLDARDDSGPLRARHTVQGLPDGQTAEFLLLAGHTD